MPLCVVGVYRTRICKGMTTWTTFRALWERMYVWQKQKPAFQPFIKDTKLWNIQDESCVFTHGITIRDCEQSILAMQQAHLRSSIHLNSGLITKKCSCVRRSTLFRPSWCDRKRNELTKVRPHNNTKTAGNFNPVLQHQLSTFMEKPKQQTSEWQPAWSAFPFGRYTPERECFM